MSKTCRYKSLEGECCEEPNLGSGYCFWHDSKIDKSKVDLIERLENHVRSGKLSKGLKLQRCNLQGINLVNQNSKKGFDLSESDLYRANLQQAHLFNVTLINGSLMKANLCDSNLHCANFLHTNLLGTKLNGARTDNLQIGNILMQESVAVTKMNAGDKEAALDHFEQSEEIYRSLRKCSEDQGLFQMAGLFSYKELLMRRNQQKKWSSSWVFSKLADLLCGYGEKPENIVFFSVFLVFISALLYFFFGVSYDGTLLKADASLTITQNLANFSMTLYYSVVTFTTLGYGDVIPVGVTRVVAAIEAFVGSFTLALFVVVFVKRMTR